MTKDLILANSIIVFYIIQRITEMLISKDNERWLKENCHAVEVDPSESIRMKVFHSLWFISLLVETNLKNDIQVGLNALIIYTVLGICMVTRFYSIEKLKKFWTIKIFSLENQVLVTDGLYKYIRHPNYLIVILEFILLPLLFKSYLTMIIFSLLNLIVLSKRIKLEEVTLMGQSDYVIKFGNIKRLVPYFLLLSIIILNPVQSKELKFHYKNYQEAKKAEDYIKFEGESTKLGFITTGFEGFIKEYFVSYELVSNQLNKLDVTISTSSLDTDVESRNIKMIDNILDKQKYPEIHASINKQLILTNGEQFVDMIFIVKDQKILKTVNVKIEKIGEVYFVTGTTVVGLTELGLPDPSIIVAKVNDNFNLKFSIHL